MTMQFNAGILLSALLLSSPALAEEQEKTPCEEINFTAEDDTAPPGRQLGNCAGYILSSLWSALSEAQSEYSAANNPKFRRPHTQKLPGSLTAEYLSYFGDYAADHPRLQIGQVEEQYISAANYAADLQRLGEYKILHCVYRTGSQFVYWFDGMPAGLFPGHPVLDVIDEDRKQCPYRK